MKLLTAPNAATKHLLWQVLRTAFQSTVSPELAILCWLSCVGYKSIGI
ncbi:hypothetical protein [uncultured Paraglaciecola sp.]